MRLVICGLDMSLTGTGLVVLNERKNIINQTLITSSAKEESIPRLIKISDQIMSKIEIFKPNLTVVEGAAFGIQKTSSIFTLGELSGIVKSNLHIKGFTFRLVAPTALKKWITGKGNSKKDVMLMKIFKQYGVEFEDDNLADAYALAQYGFQFVNPVLNRRRH